MEKTMKFRNKIKKESSMPSVATIFALMALGSVLAIYWPVFATLNHGGAVQDKTVYPLAVIYGLLFSALLFYSIFIGSLAKVTLIPAAVCSIPIFIYYFIEKVGVLEYLVFHSTKDLFFVYENNPLYYSGQNLLWIMVASVLSLLAMISFVLLCFNKTKGKTINTVVIVLAFCARIYFSVYHLSNNEFVLYNNGTYALSDITYAVLGHIAGMMFFTSILILTFAMKKTEKAPKHLKVKQIINQPDELIVDEILNQASDPEFVEQDTQDVVEAYAMSETVAMQNEQEHVLAVVDEDVTEIHEQVVEDPIVAQEIIKPEPSVKKTKEKKPTPKKPAAKKSVTKAASNKKSTKKLDAKIEKDSETPSEPSLETKSDELNQQQGIEETVN